MKLFGRSIALTLTGAALLVGSAANAGTLRYTFTLAPGANKVIPLPATQVPVQLMVSETANNGGTQTPSAVGFAVLNQDPKSKQVTWIGFKSDGTSTAGTSIPTGSPEVLDIGGGNLVVTAQASATAPTAYGKLTFTQSATRTAITVTYNVTLSY